MSDLCMYKLEEIAWEEFGGNKDHIVPRTGGKNNGSPDESDSKRARYDLSSAEGAIDHKSATKNVIHREETSLVSVREGKETMLEKDPWSHSSSGGFSNSLDGDSNRKTSCSTFEDRTTNQCTKNCSMDSIGNDSCADDSMLGQRASTAVNNLFYQLNNPNHTENDLNFLGNNLQDKENGDLLYYGWPEIETFDEVDRMFRSCDSTFGLEIDNDNELGCFSSSHKIEGSDDALKSSFNFSDGDPCATNNVSQSQDVYGLNDNDILRNETDHKFTPASLKRSSQKLTPTDLNGSVNHNENELQQIHPHANRSKQQKPSEGKRKERSLENGESFIHLDNLKQVGESNHSVTFQSNFEAESHQQLKAAPQTCFQTPIPLMDCPSNNVVASPSSSVVKSEDSGIASVSLWDSSYGSNSNQMQSMESPIDMSFQNPVLSVNKDGLPPHNLSGHLDKAKLMVQRADSDPVSSQKQVPNFESEIEGQSEVNGSELVIPGGLESSNIQESSCVSSVLDEVSIEASSFRQLQHVMDQLDIRTKLCIRDSLYRLARSAEQRHKCGSQNSESRDDKVANGALISDETNKCTGFMDMETDTNPIDRSIAHLLFHRPSDPSATAALDAVPAKVYTLVHATNMGPGMAEKPICQEQTTSANNQAPEE